MDDRRTESGEPAAPPLDSIRILDFTRFQQGPQATQMLADMGAQVIKVEETGRGDQGRRLMHDPDGFSAFFEAYNRGKRSISLNLRHAEAKRIVYRLAGDCDVVVENFRRGAMDRLGFGYERLSTANPRLIYASASGFGPRGPIAGRPSFDLIGMAMSGIMVASGGGRDREPRQPFWGLADATGAMMLAYGITMALLARERQGVGQQVDVSLLGSQLALQGADVTQYLRNGRDLVTRGRRRNFPIFGDFETATPGEYLALGALDPRQWGIICELLGLPELLTDPRFRNGYARLENADLLEPILEAAFRGKPRDHWIGAFNERGVPCGPVNDYGAVTVDPQVLANDYIVPIESPRFGTLRVVGLPVQLSRTPGRVAGTAAAPGQHTEEVLGELGYNHAQIDALRSDGVI